MDGVTWIMEMARSMIHLVRRDEISVGPMSSGGG